MTRSGKTSASNHRTNRREKIDAVSSDIAHRVRWVFISVILLAPVLVAALLALWWVRCPPRADYVGLFNALAAQHGGGPRCRNGHDAAIALDEQAEAILEEADARGRAAWNASPESYDPENFPGWKGLSWNALLETPATVPDKRMRDAVESAVADLESKGFFDRLSRLSSYDCFTPPPRSGVLDEFVAGMQVSHSFGTLACVRLTDALEGGDPAHIRARLDDALTLARVSSSNPTWMSAASCASLLSRICLALTERCIALPRLNEVALAEVAHALDRPEPLQSVSAFMEGSRLITRAELAHPVLGGTDRALLSPRAYWAHVMGRTRARAEAIDESWHAAARMLSQPRGLRQPVPGWNDLLNRAGHFEKDNFYDLPDIEIIATTVDRPRMLWHATRLVIAIERHRAATGRYPESLDELTPQFFSEIPADPYDPDGRFRYRRIDPLGDPFCRGYLLWSVAIDGDDNNGSTTPPDIDPWRTLWVRSEDGLGLMPGYDYVVNEPQRPRE